MLKTVYQKLFKINDTPQKIAAGFGVGIFTGILPGTGPIAALFLALLFRVNRASALLGSLLTNTWLSLVTFILSVKVGSVIMNVDWRATRCQWRALLSNFHWKYLFTQSALKIALPVAIGYFLISLTLGLLAYAVALVLLYANRRIRHERKPLK